MRLDISIYMMKNIFVIFYVLLIPYVIGEHERDILNLYKQQFTGDGTYYGNVLGGMCQLNTPDLPPVAKSSKIAYLVALNSRQMFHTLGCGMCFKVHGTGQGLGNDPITGDFIVYVKDLCPECHAGALDFAVNGDGRWKINIQAVQCPVGSGKIEYKFQGSHEWYIKLQVRNERMPATKVEMFQPKSRQWLPLQRTNDGFWTMGSGHFEKPVKRPFKIRLHSPTGQQLEDTVGRIANDVVIHGNGVQFDQDHSLLQA